MVWHTLWDGSTKCIFDSCAGVGYVDSYTLTGLSLPAADPSNTTWAKSMGAFAVTNSTKRLAGICFSRAAVLPSSTAGAGAGAPSTYPPPSPPPPLSPPPSSPYPPPPSTGRRRLETVVNGAPLIVAQDINILVRDAGPCHISSASV